MNGPWDPAGSGEAGASGETPSWVLDPRNGNRWRPSFTTTVLVLILSIGGCDDTRSATSGRDDRALTNSREGIERVSEWSLSADPEMSIGVAQGEGPQLFGTVRDGVVGPHGVYVLDGRNMEVRIFDRSGDHVMSLGGEGEGPGEFSNPTHLVVGADSTISVWDRGLHRLTAFDHGGEVTRLATVHQSFSNPFLEGVLSDGSFFLSDFGMLPGLGVRATRSLTLSRFSASGALIDTIAELSGATVTAMRGFPRPFSSADLIGGAAEGVWVLDVDTALIALIGPSSDTIRTVEWEPPSREVRDSDLDAYEGWLSGAISSEQRRAEMVEHLRRPGFAAERHPAAVRLMTDAVGRIWIVERHDWDRIQSPTWLVFDRSGQAVGRLAEPLEDVEILDADEDHALVRTTDELGIHRVQLRRIVKSGARRR